MLTFYVATDGNNAGQGTERQPFATVTRAVAAAREVEGERQVIIRGGTYFAVSLELTPDDNGLTIAAAPGERVVLYGGRSVTGWRQDGDFVAADLPEVRAGTWDFRMLLVNGRFAPRARLPKEGTFEHENTFTVPWMSTTGGGWQRKPTETELTTMRYKPGDLGPWLNINNAEFTIYHQWDESMLGVKHLDPDTRTVTFSSPGGHPPGAFGVNTYAVWNVREGMTQPGQWYLDRTAGTVVYWPLPGETMAQAEVIAPTTESIIRLSGTEERPVTGVTLRGLELAVTSTPLRAGGFGAGMFDGAITASHVQNCHFDGLTVRHTGGQAVKLASVQDVKITDCHLYELGACAVTGSGSATEIGNCHLHHVGLSYPSAIALNLSGERNLISHNEIHHTPYSAIGSSGAHSRYEYNLFYDVMQVLRDGAAIYITFCKDMTVRGNVVRGAGSSLSHAYYLDEQAENCVVEGNLAVNTRWPSHNHMARNCIIRDNVFIDDGDLRMTFPRCAGFTFARNVVYAAGAIHITAPPDGIAAMPDNVIYSQAGTVMLETLGADGYSGEHIDPLAPRDGTRFADPLFMDVRNGNYRYAPDSPAKKMGLLPVEASHAGRVKE